MWGLDRYWPMANWIVTPWHYLGLGLIGIAGLFDLWSLRLFFKAETTFNPLKPERTQALVTKGLYRYTRNPMYVGLLVMLVGLAIFLGSISPFLILPVFMWIITTMQIIPEEMILQQKFGQMYQDYRQRVPRWLIW